MLSKAISMQSSSPKWKRLHVLGLIQDMLCLGILHFRTTYFQWYSSLESNIYPLRNSRFSLKFYVSRRLTYSMIISAFQSPLWVLILGSFGDLLCLCGWRYRRMRSSIDQRMAQGLNGEYKVGSSAVIEQAKIELAEYFDGNEQSSPSHILVVGSDF